MFSRKKITPSKAVEYITELIRLFPEYTKNLAREKKEKAYWSKLLKSPHGKLVMDILCEMPAFTSMLPKKRTRSGWTKVFGSYMGPSQIARIISTAATYAEYEPVERKKIVNWRDAFGAGEIVQRARPEPSSGTRGHP